MNYKKNENTSEIRARYKSMDFSTGINSNLVSIDQTQDSK